MSVAKVACSLLALTLAPLGAWAEASTPLALLDRMNTAIRTLDYEGRLVVQSGDRLDALYLVHRVSDGAEKERVVSLTGEPREIIRGDQAVACVVPGRESPISVGRRERGRSYSPLAVIDGHRLKEFYRFERLDDDRAAGRLAHQMEIQPRDGLRFGYRLLVDRASGLPLRTMVLDADGKTHSQMMFTDLKIGEGVTPIEHDLSALEIARSDPGEWSPLERLARPSWHFADVPPGFRLDVHRRRALQDKSAELEHFIFSDGLATVSVYVQPAENPETLRGVSRRGAANTVLRAVGNHQVFAVGEVPVETLNRFADGIGAAR